jgi:hypothetical protein
MILLFHGAKIKPNEGMGDAKRGAGESVSTLALVVPNSSSGSGLSIQRPSPEPASRWQLRPVSHRLGR